MLCEKCGQKEASVYFTEIKDNQKLDVSLCEDCAKDNQSYITSPALQYSVNDIVGNLIQLIAGKNPQHSNATCDHCGISYHEFHISGRFGCERDYKAFRKDVKKLFLDIHNSNHHKGKVPHQLKLQNKIDNLKAKLEKCIKKEDYEKASEINSLIQKLEKSAYD